MVAAAVCPAQSAKPAAGGFAVFSKVETGTVPTGMDLTVVCSKPVEPGFTQLKDPERLVIDLPDTLVGNHPTAVPLNTPDVRAMRINQFQKDPPITRIVLDLVGERDYSYEPSGSSFIVHLRGVQPAGKPSQAASLAEGTVGLGLRQSGPKPVVLAMGNLAAGNQVAPGSAITAGGDTAVLKLERGGEIHICPGTTASVTPSPNGRSLMTGMSEGAVELHYPLAAAADTVLTPDFRILLPGPGEFHYAISADTKGNTCVRALQGNTASAVVSELMGDGTYQVKPGEQVVFRSGRLAQADANVPLECGCPPPRQPQLLATGSTPTGPHQVPVPTDGSLPTASPDAASSGGPAATKPQVIVDAPFVFRGSDAPPNVNREVAKLPAARAPQSETLVVVAPKKAKKVRAKKVKAPGSNATPIAAPAATPPPKPQAPPPPPPQPTFLARVKGFFRSIFK